MPESLRERIARVKASGGETLAQRIARVKASASRDPWDTGFRMNRVDLREKPRTPVQTQPTGRTPQELYDYAVASGFMGPGNTSGDPGTFARMDEQAAAMRGGGVPAFSDEFMPPNPDTVGDVLADIPGAILNAPQRLNVAITKAGAAIANAPIPFTDMDVADVAAKLGLQLDRYGTPPIDLSTIQPEPTTYIGQQVAGALDAAGAIGAGLVGGPMATAAMFGVQSAGHSFDEAQRLGMDPRTAADLSLAKGVVGFGAGLIPPIKGLPLGSAEQAIAHGFGMGAAQTAGETAVDAIHDPSVLNDPVSIMQNIAQGGANTAIGGLAIHGAMRAPGRIGEQIEDVRLRLGTKIKRGGVPQEPPQAPPVEPEAPQGPQIDPFAVAEARVRKPAPTRPLPELGSNRLNVPVPEGMADEVTVLKNVRDWQEEHAGLKNVEDMIGELQPRSMAQAPDPKAATRMTWADLHAKLQKNAEDVAARRAEAAKQTEESVSESKKLEPEPTPEPPKPEPTAPPATMKMPPATPDVAEPTGEPSGKTGELPAPKEPWQMTADDLGPISTFDPVPKSSVFRGHLEDRSGNTIGNVVQVAKGVYRVLRPKDYGKPGEYSGELPGGPFRADQFTKWRMDQVSGSQSVPVFRFVGEPTPEPAPQAKVEPPPEPGATPEVKEPVSEPKPTEPKPKETARAAEPPAEQPVDTSDIGDDLIPGIEHLDPTDRPTAERIVREYQARERLAADWWNMSAKQQRRFKRPQPLNQRSDDAFDKAFASLVSEVKHDGPKDTRIFALPGKEKTMLDALKKAGKVTPENVPEPKVEDAPRTPNLSWPKAGDPRKVAKVAKTPQDRIASVAVARATDGGRYAITGVFQDADALVATDGRRLFILNGKHAEPGLYAVEKNPNLDKGVLTKANEKDEGTFPPYKDLVPGKAVRGHEPKHSFTVDTLAAARDARRAALATSEERRGVLVVRNTDGSLGFAAGGIVAGSTVEINVRDGYNELFVVDPKYFAEAMDFARKNGDAKPTLSMQKDGTPIVVKGEHTTTVTMPIKFDPEVQGIDAVRRVEVYPGDVDAGVSYLSLAGQEGRDKFIGEIVGGSDRKAANTLANEYLYRDDVDSFTKTQIRDALKAADAAAKKASPSSAKQPPGSRAEAFGQSLTDTGSEMVRKAVARMEARAKERGFRLYANPLPSRDMLDTALMFAGHAIKAGGEIVKGGVALTRFIESKIKDVPGLEVEATFNAVRRMVAKMLREGKVTGGRVVEEKVFAVYQRLAGRLDKAVRAQIEKDTGLEIPEAAPLTVADRNAERHGFDMANEVFQTQVRDLVGRARAAMKRQRQMGDIEQRGAVDAQKYRQQEARELQDLAADLADEVPMRIRGDFVRRVARADTPRKVIRVALDMARARDRYEGTQAARYIAERTTKAQLRKLSPERRDAVGKIMAEIADDYALIRTPQAAPVKPSEYAINAASRNLIGSAGEIRAIRAEQRSERKAMLEGKAIAIKDARDEMVATLSKRPDIPYVAGPGHSLGIFKRSDMMGMMPDTLGQWLDNGTNTGPFSRVVRDMIATHRESLSLRQSTEESLENAVKANGYKSMAHFLAQTSDVMGRANMRMTDVRIPHSRERLSYGEAMMIAAMDPMTKGQTDAGRRLGFKGEHGSGTFVLSPELRAQAEAAIDPKDRAIIRAWKKVYGDTFTERLDAQRFELTGERMERVEDYQSVRVIPELAETIPNTPEWAKAMDKNIGDAGFYEVRRDTRSPIEIEDFGSRMLSQVRAASDVLSKAKLQRELFRTLQRGEVVEAMTRKTGKETVKRLNDLISDWAGTRLPEDNLLEKAVRVTLQGVGRAKTQANPFTWAKQLGTIPIMAHEIGWENYAKHSQHHVNRDMYRELMRNAPELRERYSHPWVGTVLGEHGAEVESGLGWGDIGTMSLRQLGAVSGDIARGRLGEAKRDAAGVGRVWMAGLDKIKIANYADGLSLVPAYMHFKERAASMPELKTQDARNKWAAQQTEEAFFRSGNANTTMRSDGYASLARRQPARAIIYQFTSDLVQRRNVIRRAVMTKDAAKIASAVTGVVASSLLTGAVIYARARIALSAGSKSDKEKHEEALRTALDQLAQDMAGDLYPGAGRLLEWSGVVRRATGSKPAREPEMFGSPLGQTVDYVNQFISELGKATQEQGRLRGGKAGRKSLDRSDHLLRAADAVFRAASHVIGAPWVPAYELARTMRKEADR